MQVVLDIMRKWIQDNPVKMENIKENSPARVLLAQPSKYVLVKVFLHSI